MITIPQIRAARGLLGWSQKDLADAAGLSQTGIARIESGESAPGLKTLEAIVLTFKSRRVLFSQTGVYLSESPITIFEGSDFYLQVLDNLIREASAVELLLICADDRASPPEVNDRLRILRRRGVKMRQLIEEGNVYILGPLAEYRYVPSKNFHNYVSLIYGSKVIICTDSNSKAVMFDDESLSKTWCNLFNMMWDSLPQPEKTNAIERF